MKSWRTLITAGLTAGAAAVILPLTVMPAAAGPDMPGGWSLAGGTYPTAVACLEDGADYIDDTYHDYVQYHCHYNGNGFVLWVR